MWNILSGRRAIEVEVRSEPSATQIPQKRVDGVERGAVGIPCQRNPIQGYAHDKVIVAHVRRERGFMHRLQRTLADNECRRSAVQAICETDWKYGAGHLVEISSELPGSELFSLRR